MIPIRIRTRINSVGKRVAPLLVVAAMTGIPGSEVLCAQTVGFSYTLGVPPEATYWLLAKTQWDAIVQPIEKESVQPDVKWMESHPDDFSRYFPGVPVRLLERAPRACRVTTEGKSDVSSVTGYVDCSALFPTPETQAKLDAQKRAADAAKRAADERERIARAVRREYCAKLYRYTADKRIADITVEQSRQIELCRREGIYEP